jgi:hypothetical protein
MKSLKSTSFLVLVLLVSSVPAMAQYTDRLGGNWANPASAMITNIIMDRYAQRRLKKNLESKRTAPTPGAAVNDAQVHFRPTGTQLKTVEIANLIGPGNPQVQAIMTAILQEYEKNARAAGKPNDVALALSFFFATNASVYHDAGEPSDAKMLELRETIADALVEGNAMRGVTDRQKQEMYETLVLFTGFALAAYQEGKQSGNAESVRVGQQLAGQNLQSVTGISPDKISFTSQGLSIEREVAASSEPEAQPAPNSTTNQGVASVDSINAGKLVIEFEGNEVRANQMYGGKRIRVTGIVNSIEVAKGGQITLTFHSPAGGFAQTQCYFNKSQSSRVANFSGGGQALVEGTVRGLAGGLGGKGYVILEDCTVP